MARLPRLDVAQWPHLVVQQVLAGERLVRDADDRKALWLAMMGASREQQLAVHAYAILDSRFYLLATPAQQGALGAFMQSVGRRYVAAYNRRHDRQGTLWAGRFRATVLDPAQYLLDAMAFIELQAQPDARLQIDGGHAGVAGQSSRPFHLQQGPDALVQDHVLFWRLGNTPFEREAVWRKRLESDLSEVLKESMAQAMFKGWALAEGDALLQLECACGRRMAPRARGRPRKLTP